MKRATKYTYDFYKGPDLFGPEAKRMQMRQYRAWRKNLLQNRFRFWLFGGWRVDGSCPGSCRNQGHVIRRTRTSFYWWIQRTFNLKEWREHEAWIKTLPGYDTSPSAIHLVVIGRPKDD